MAKPTQKDGEMLIQLYRVINTREMMDAFTWALMLEKTTYDEFTKKHPMGSQEHGIFMRIASFIRAARSPGQVRDYKRGYGSRYVRPVLGQTGAPGEGHAEGSGQPRLVRELRVPGQEEVRLEQEA